MQICWDFYSPRKFPSSFHSQFVVSYQGPYRQILSTGVEESLCINWIPGKENPLPIDHYASFDLERNGVPKDPWNRSM